MSYDEKSRKHDSIDRGNYDKNNAGTAAFFCSRLLDPIVQYALLKHGLGDPLIRRLRGTTLPQGPPVLTNTPFDRLGLSPYRTILFTMSLGSMVKQNYHLAMIMQEKMTVGFGLQVGVMNMVGNTLNTLLFMCAQTSASTNGQTFPQTPLLVGSTLFVAGILIEWVSEQQRHNWKSKPSNKGKLYGGGLFSLSRHINYFGYTLWRAGYACAAGGWLWGAAVGSLAAMQFSRVTIPVHQQYLEEKYGQQFEHYKQVTPHKFVPGLW